MATRCDCKAAGATLTPSLNIDRLLRDVEGRLAAWDAAAETALEVMDALREAMARERRSLDPTFTVESERERRQNAEELRGALEAIHRSVRSRRGARRGAEAARARGADRFRRAGGGRAGGRAAHRGRARSRAAGLRGRAARGRPARRRARARSAGRGARCATPRRTRRRSRSSARRRCARGWRCRCCSRATWWACWSPGARRSTPSATRTCSAPRRSPSGRRRRCGASSSSTSCAATRRCSSRWRTSTSASSAARAPTRSPRRSSRAPAASAATAAGCSSCRPRAGRWWRRAHGERPRRGRRAQRTRRPRVDRGAPPARRPHARRGRVARHGAARRAGLTSCPLATPEGYVGCLALLDPNGESPGRPAARGLRLARGRSPGATPRCTTAAREAGLVRL